MPARPRPRRRGLSLLEVAIAGALLTLLGLMVLTATTSLSDASAVQGAALDMDRDAARFFTQLRRELRQSGYETDGTPRVRVLAPGPVTGERLELYLRQGPDGTASPWRPAGAPWSGGQITWSLGAPLDGRRELARSESGASLVVLRGVQSLTWTLPANSTSVSATLVLVRRGHKAVGGAAPPDVVRSYTDRIAMMNQRD